VLMRMLGGGGGDRGDPEKKKYNPLFGIGVLRGGGGLARLSDGGIWFKDSFGTEKLPCTGIKKEIRGGETRKTPGRLAAYNDLGKKVLAIIVCHFFSGR